MDVMFVAVTLAHQAAIKAVKSKVRSQGKIRISEVSAAQWSAMGREYLAQHRELIEAELAKDLCYELASPKRRRRPLSLNQKAPNPALKSLGNSKTEIGI
jgi:hypothetical protein